MKNKHIVMMAGGTGGHVYPALAVAQTLIKHGYSVSWLGCADRFEAQAIPQAGFELDTLSIGAIRGKGLGRKLRLPWVMARAIWQARRALKIRQPLAVIGMGGFAAAPGGLAARWLNIPLFIHEQNAIAGLTNRLLARFAQQVFSAYPQAFPATVTTQVIGNPLRQAILDLPAKTISPADQPLNILVTGGSQGAHQLNHLVPQAIAHCQQNIRIRHQSGARDVETTRKDYQMRHIDAHVTAFIDDMPQAYRWADLIICRAGALTVAETQAAGLPAIFIPLPYAVDDHQRHNAESLSKKKLAWCLTGPSLSATTLAQQLDTINRQTLQLMANQLQQDNNTNACVVILAELDAL